MNNLSLAELRDVTYAPTLLEGEVIQLWQRQVHEPEQSYQLFVSYYLPLGITRTIEKAWLNFYKEHSEQYQFTNQHIVPTTWKRVCKVWEWSKRANAWDAEQQRIRQLEWTARQEEVKQNEWDTYKLASKALRDGVSLYADYLATVIEQDGTKKISKPPVTSLDLERFGNLVLQFGRLPTGLATVNTVNTEMPAVLPESIDDTRAKRWELMQSRLLDAPGNVIEGVFDAIEN